MSDEVIMTVFARLEAEQTRMMMIDKQIVELRDAYARAESEVKRLVAFVETYSELMGAPVAPQLMQMKHLEYNSERVKNPPRAVVVSNAISILKKNKKPMPRRLLMDALRRRGIVIKGKDPEMVLSTMLWRDQDRVVRIKSHGYWLKGVEYPPADYWPEIESVIGVTSSEPEDGMIAGDVD